jgi:ankyrin repeat protein
MFSNIYYGILRMCKTLRIRDYGKYDFRDYLPVDSSDYLEYISNGELDKLKKCKNYNNNEALNCAVNNNQKEIVDYLIGTGKADNLNECLTIACKKNYYDISELLVKGGAKTVFGLRASKSPNIIRMLYRYEQGSEVIM